MSQSQKVQQTNQQEQQNNIACKSRKKRNRRKRSHVAECNPKELVGAVNGSSAVAERKPLHTSMEKLQMAQKPTTPVASRKAAGSNWEAVVEAKTCDQGNIVAKAEGNPSEEPVLSKSARKRLKRRAAENKYVAMDCEMVGVGFNGEYDMLARVSIVNKRGQVLLDKFVKPQKAVTDYRTSVSGIRPHDINNGEDFNSVRKEVIKIIQDKILVGHGLQKDLAVLHIKHPRKNIRDTSGYKPLCRTVANGRTPSLKHLTYTILGKQIQNGEHNSVEDARAAMSIYNTLASDWEAYIKKIQHNFSK